MGIRYALCALTLRDHSELLLPELSKLLDDKSRARIEHLEWAPEEEVERQTLIGTTDLDAQGIAGLATDPYEPEYQYCLSLHVQLESEMGQFVGYDADYLSQPASFGCMWTSVCAGREFLLLRLGAATSGMSRVLQSSQVIQKMWREFAERVFARVAYIEIGDDLAIQLVPSPGELYLPDFDVLAYANDYRVSIDRLGYFVSATAK